MWSSFLVVRQAWRTVRKHHSLNCGGSVSDLGVLAVLAIVPYGP